MYRSIEKPIFALHPVGQQQQLSGEVWFCLSKNSGQDPDPMDFEELRLQPLGQQQAPAQAEQSCWPENSLSWPSTVWRESGVTDFQLGDCQNCK